MCGMFNWEVDSIGESDWKVEYEFWRNLSMSFPGVYEVFLFHFHFASQKGRDTPSIRFSLRIPGADRTRQLRRQSPTQ